MDQSVTVGKPFTGILITKDNKIIKTEKGKTYYKCYCSDSLISPFLMPYTLKWGFQKNVENKYILFSFEKQSNGEIKPKLLQVFGSVSDKEAFLQWTLYKHEIFFPKPKWTVSNNPMPLPKVEDRTFLTNIFTIDPEGCMDLDDAISFKNNKISIYISNVPLQIETNHLWESISNQVNTIYLPNTTRHLLSTTFATSTCSLVNDNLEKVVIAMDWDIRTNEKKILPTKIKISNNYIYEEKKLLKRNDYQLLLKACREISPTIKDSHDLISFLMIEFNSFCAGLLKEGIFRTTFPKQKKYSFFPYYGAYTLDKTIKHSLLQVEQYAHCSSPIRRTVDIVNLALLQQELGMYTFSDKCQIFIKKWKSNLDTLNNICKTIQNVQNQFFLLEHFESTDFMKEKAIILDKTDESTFHFYFPNLKCSVFQKIEQDIMTTPLLLDSEIMCRLYLISEENTLVKKLVVHVEKNN